MTSVIFSDALNTLRGLSGFFGVLRRGRLTTPGTSQRPAGNTGGGRKPVSLFMVRGVKVSDDKLPGVQLAVASPTQAFRLMTQTPLDNPSASHVGSPSVQVSTLMPLPMVADAELMSHRAAQFPFLPATSSAWACDSTPAVSRRPRSNRVQVRRPDLMACVRASPGTSRRYTPRE